jgi:hypothetical protein
MLREFLINARATHVSYHDMCVYSSTTPNAVGGTNLHKRTNFQFHLYWTYFILLLTFSLIAALRNTCNWLKDSLNVRSSVHKPSDVGSLIIWLLSKDCRLPPKWWPESSGNDRKQLPCKWTNYMPFLASDKLNHIRKEASVMVQCRMFQISQAPVCKACLKVKLYKAGRHMLNPLNIIQGHIQMAQRRESRQLRWQSHHLVHWHDEDLHTGTTRGKKHIMIEGVK